MIELLTGLPDNVVGFKAIGEVEDDDYEDVLIPTVEDALKRHKKIRVLYVLGDEFKSYEGDAMWDDAKIGMEHPFSYERIAVASDVKWVRRSIKAFGVLMPGHVKVFHAAELDDAKAWITQD